MKRIGPPIPAPYLADVGQLPSELRAALKREPTPEDESQADSELSTLKQQVFQARMDFEEREGVLIVPEPPLKPWRYCPG